MATHIAVDIGTSSGTIVAGTVDETIHTEEVHRFDTRRIQQDNHIVWDVDHLVRETTIGLIRAEAEYGQLSTIGIDATAEMFGLVADGEVIRAPIHTTSVHTDSSVKSLTSERMFFEAGHTRLPTSYDRLCRRSPSLVEQADWLGLLPALVAAGLGARPHGEVTYAISTGLGNTCTRRWAQKLLQEAGLPTNIFPELTPVGSTVGTVSLEGDQSLNNTPDIVVVPGHDTSAAVASIPFQDEASAFLATGSWFITGFEVEKPLISRAAYDAAAENVGGIDGTARFVRNTPGLSLLEHCRNHWTAEGQPIPYDQLLTVARDAPSFGPLIDPGADLFLESHFEGDTVRAIHDFCHQTEQSPPDGQGEIVRCLLESLAASSAVLLERLGSIADRQPETLYLVGGGARNPLLCHLVASATNTTICVGPTEATALGSLLVQFRSSGEIQSLERGRTLVDRTIDPTYIEPRNHTQWCDALDLMRDFKCLNVYTWQIADLRARSYTARRVSPLQLLC
jgi:rhamnulokinase